MSEPLWRPSGERKAAANLTAFMAQLQADWGVAINDYPTLYRWSCDQIEQFWQSLWGFSGVIAENQGSVVLRDGDTMSPAARFFPDAKLNFARNLLRRCGDGDAIVFWAENKLKRRLSHDQLHDQVAGLAAALIDMGIVEGDRVVGFLPNIPEAVVAMLATASLGAVWSSCSPDFGVQGVVDRFGQIKPKVLFCADGYLYKGKEYESLVRVGEFTRQLPSLDNVVVASYMHAKPDLSPLAASLTSPAGAPSRVPRITLFDELLADRPAGNVPYRSLPFNHPLYILYSSGTTGKPKCIVHGAGGTLLKHLLEHQLMCDVKPGDRIFYFTTCGWMMWNWLASGLASEATLLLYDGNPVAPGPEVLFDYAEAEKMTLFGTSAKYLDALRNAGLEPRSSHDLSSLRTITSTGSPLAPEGFDYVYERIKQDVCLSSISGGTDIIGCFVGGNPIGPVWRGEIQARSLGMAVDIFDAEGRPLRGEKGELVCTRPFPSMPAYFWNDPDGARYRSAYFEKYPDVWWHGDFAAITEHDGVIIYGRSDATLNPGGVRIGTAEIYRQAEKLTEVDEAIAIGQDWHDDVRIVLFVKLREGLELGDRLVEKIASEIRSGCSPRHVPAKILQVTDIPRTKSGKIVELAVREVVHGRPVKNIEALANPEALELFRNRPELND
ncbi:MAG: acetoacetate--CoA ligase [Acidobacteriota bacterium]